MKPIFFAFISISLMMPAGLQAQFIQYQMNVEPELRTNVVQDINFGDFLANSGTQQIKKGNSNMGIFEIRGLQNQTVAVLLNPPHELQHANPEIDQSIPTTLEASYTTRGQDINESQPFSANHTCFSIGGENSPSSITSPWQSAYVYVYGSVTIGDVPAGTYEGTMVLTVEYQ